MTLKIEAKSSMNTGLLAILPWNIHVQPKRIQAMKTKTYTTLIEAIRTPYSCFVTVGPQSTRMSTSVINSKPKTATFRAARLLAPLQVSRSSSNSKFDDDIMWWTMVYIYCYDAMIRQTTDDDDFVCQKHQTIH